MFQRLAVGAEPEFQKAMASRFKLKAFDKGKLVYHIEDTGPEMFCLVSGSVAITVAHPTMGAVAAHVMHPGDWFGEVAVLSRGSRLVTVHSRARIPLHLDCQEFNRRGDERRSSCLPIASSI